MAIKIRLFLFTDTPYVFWMFNPISPTIINSIEAICIQLSFSLNMYKPATAMSTVLAPAHIALAIPAGNCFNASVRKISKDIKNECSQSI